MAVHLEERALPPWGLWALLGYDCELCAEVESAFTGLQARCSASKPC